MSAVWAEGDGRSGGGGGGNQAFPIEIDRGTMPGNGCGGGPKAGRATLLAAAVGSGIGRARASGRPVAEEFLWELQSRSDCLACLMQCGQRGERGPEEFLYLLRLRLRHLIATLTFASARMHALVFDVPEYSGMLL